jgi:protein SSD1
LVPGQERLTFSIVFTMTKDTKVVKKWFGKTVIKSVHVLYHSIDIDAGFVRSAARLSYQDAQNIVEGRVLGGVAVAPEHHASDIEHDIKNLEDLAKKLRAQCFKNGTLSLDSPRLVFDLDENGNPVDCGQYKQTDANYLIREVCYSIIADIPPLNMLSNVSVAQHIAVNLPEQALLCHHDNPMEH